MKVREPWLFLFVPRARSMPLFLFILFLKKGENNVNKAKRLIALGLIAILALLLAGNPLSTRYLQERAAFSTKENELQEKIEQAAERFYRPPENARIDRVWKAIPGYNGVEVDKKASYSKMKQDGRYDERKLVFKQIPPAVHLKDLDPAPVYTGNPDKPMVAFLINVAWGNEYLPDMLKTLKNHHLHATFFLEGRWAKENPELARMIVSGGHETGNHSYTHPDFSTLPESKIKSQLVKTNRVLEAITEEKVKWFAPPSGSYRDEAVSIAKSMGMETIMWTVDTVDWQNPSPEAIVERVIAKAQGGSLILMHPTASTAKALEPLIARLEKKNLQVGTVSKLLDEERIIKNEDGTFLNSEKDPADTKDGTE
ncbi:polysaccharide deacetylase family protein [Heyndrickxia faecalis]|uniref:polysaccharide deacetylase family protein n=1 Tax=Heyndrickxia faecalis TaxID=2824910 RepID=UPI003D1EB960